MSSRLNAPCTRERGTWLEPDQVLAGPKCIRRTGHRLNGQAATAYVGQRVAAEEHQITVALVHPERDLSVVVRISEHHARQTILISLEVGERMVERCRADPSGFPKIVRRAFRGFRRSEDRVLRIARQFAQVRSISKDRYLQFRGSGTDEHRSQKGRGHGRGLWPSCAPGVRCPKGHTRC